MKTNKSTYLLVEIILSFILFVMVQIGHILDNNILIFFSLLGVTLTFGCVLGYIIQRE